MHQDIDRTEAFLARCELRLKLKYLGDDRPEGRTESSKLPHYIVTVRRVNGPKFSFDFWHNVRGLERGESHEPTAHEILASLGESSRLSPDPDDVYEEFGEMKPSQAVGMARFAMRVRKFFTHRELIELRKIGLEASVPGRANNRRVSSEKEPLKHTA